MGSNPGGRRDFPPIQTSPGAHPASCTMGTVSFPGVKYGRGVLLITTHPLLVPRSWKSRAIPLPTLWATPACNRITLPLPFINCIHCCSVIHLNACDAVRCCMYVCVSVHSVPWYSMGRPRVQQHTVPWIPLSSAI